MVEFRAPPHDLEAERSTLGSILLAPRVLDEIAAMTNYRLGHLRESGDIEQAAHVVAFLDEIRFDAKGRPNYPIPAALTGLPPERIRVLDVKKNRNGDTGVIPLGEWVKERTRVVWPEYDAPVQPRRYAEFDNYEGKRRR